MGVSDSLADSWLFKSRGFRFLSFFFDLVQAEIGEGLGCFSEWIAEVRVLEEMSSAVSQIFTLAPCLRLLILVDTIS
jgi:hypothetical protein